MHADASGHLGRGPLLGLALGVALVAPFSLSCGELPLTQCQLAGRAVHLVLALFLLLLLARP